MKIKGLKKAVGKYQRYNTIYSYGRLMFDVSTGEIWCDVFFDLTRQTQKKYSSPNVVNLGELMNDAYFGETFSINMKTVKTFIMEKYPEFAE